MLGTETGHLAGGATEDTAPPFPTESVWQAARTQANAVGLSRNQVVPRFPERSLLASCADAARKWPDHPSISSDGRMVTYRQLWDVIQHIAGRIDQSGAPDGPVAIMLEDALLYSAAILGVLAAGRVVLPIDMSNPLARNLAHLIGCEPKLWDQAAAFDDASGWLRLAGADGLSASAAQ